MSNSISHPTGQYCTPINNKNDTKKKQTALQLDAWREIFKAVTSEEPGDRFGFCVEADSSLAEDPTGDQLDALLCAVQAAWAWRNRDKRYGAPDEVDPLEGWIAGPVFSKSA